MVCKVAYCLAVQCRHRHFEPFSTSRARSVCSAMQAPEVMQGGKPSAASDVYSFGMVLYELLTWTLPWRASPFKASFVAAG